MAAPNKFSALPPADSTAVGPPPPPPARVPPQIIVGPQGPTGPPGASVIGPQGAVGPVGPVGPSGAAGPTGPGVVGLLATAPPAGMVAARGDRLSDDTAAVQALAARARDSGGLPLLLPPGIYALSSPLLLGQPPAGATPGAVLQGFLLRGLSGPAVQSDTAGRFGVGEGGGVGLLATADNLAAVVQVGTGGTRGNVITGVMLDGGAALHTAAGLYAPATFWSGLTLDDVSIQNVDTAILVGGPGDSGSDGEFLVVRDSALNARYNILINDTAAGQAFPWHWSGARCQLSQPGGTCVTLGSGRSGHNYGYSFAWSGVSMSFYTQSGLSAASPVSTFFKSFGFNNAAFFGGRVEGCGTLSNIQAGGGGQLLVENVHFDGMNGFAPLLVDTGNSTLKAVFRDCTFTSYAATAVSMSLVSPASQYVFEDCDFYDWSDYAALTADARVTRIRCRARVSGGALGAL